MTAGIPTVEKNQIFLKLAFQSGVIDGDIHLGRKKYSSILGQVSGISSFINAPLNAYSVKKKIPSFIVLL